MNLGILNQAIKKTFFSEVEKIATTGTLKQLGVQQIGLFTDTGLSEIKVATGTEKEVFFAQGILKFKAQKSFGGGYSNSPRKSITFNPKNIKEFRGVKANREIQAQKVALGFDGVDASKTLTTMLDRNDLQINIRLHGELINRVMGKNQSLYKQIYINKGKIDQFGNYTDAGSGDIIADDIIAQLDNSLFTIGYKFSDLVSYKKVERYAVAPAAMTGLLPFHSFTVSICDDGGSAALGLIQSQYTGFEVSRVGRICSVSTYKVMTPDALAGAVYSAALPVAVSLSARTVANCEVCPTGSTKVSSAKAFVLKAAIGTAVPTIAGAISTTLLGSTITQKSYLVVVPETAVNSVVIADGVADGYDTKLVGGTRDICNFPATTYTWTQTGQTFYKAPAQWKITLADTVCGTDRLAELQAHYLGSTVAIEASGECSKSYTISNYSEIVEDVACSIETYVYLAPASFESVQWVKFKASLALPTCTVDVNEIPCKAVGIIFEGIFAEDETVDENTIGYFGYDPNRILPVYIDISVNTVDPQKNLSYFPEYPVTLLQSVKIPQGFGREVMEEERYMLMDELKQWSPNLPLNNIFGFSFNTKDGKWYDYYEIFVQSPKQANSLTGMDTNDYRLGFRFEEGKGKEFETLINGIISKNGLSVDPVLL